MTSLEFIEKEIKQLEERKENAFKNEYYSIYKECSQKITALQQIKTILEAWEIVEDNTIITNNRCCVDTIEMYKGGKGYNIFKKALEVEKDGKN